MQSGVNVGAQGPGLQPSPSDAAQQVNRYVRALRRRATALYGVRALCAASGASALALLVMSASSGPVVTPALSRAAVFALAVVFVAAAGWLLWPARRLSGLGSCQLLRPARHELASRVRSTLELVATDETGSPALINAHAIAVHEELAALPVARVVPYDWLRHPTVFGGVGLLLFSAVLLAQSVELRAGAYAIFHPARVRSDGIRIAPVVAATSARLIYPSYLGRKPSEVSDEDNLRVPRGTTVELTVTPRLATRQGMVTIGDAQVRLRAVPDGRLFARFVARESRPLRIRVESEGAWYEDSAARSIEALADAVPVARLLSPADGSIVEADVPLQVRFSTHDDHGLASVELAVRLPGGEEQRRRIWSSVSSDGPKRSLDDATVLAPAELGARPGDVIVLWIEARDADAVGGPNIGISEAATIEVASDAQKFAMHVPRLRELLDGALDVLADRLDAPLPEEAEHARQRMEELHGGITPWLERIAQLVGDAERAAEELPIDLDQLQGILDRTQRELRRESAAYRGKGAQTKRWSEVNARVTIEHEKDVLLLADTLAQALVDEARALTDELAQLKTEIRDLLDQYKEAGSPEAKRALLAEIAKAQRRLRELAESLGRLSKRVPSEFINQEAMPSDSARSSIDDLKAAIEAGDMLAAEQHLDALSKRIDELTTHIDSGGARFRESRFGARDQAMAQARSRVGMLADEQQRLAQRSRDLVQRATERAQREDSPKGQTQKLEALAQDVEEQLEALGGGNMGSHEARMLDSARNRVRDTRDALSTGDMAEANRMAAAARRSLDQAAASIGQDAQMFPGHQGETSDRARAADEANQGLSNLQKRIAEQTPGLGDHVTDAERGQMRGDGPAQRAARKLAEELEGQLGTGPGETPLSPEGERSMRDATEAMREAERALDRGDPQRAALAQEAASERIQQAQERMRDRGRGSKGERRGDRGDGSREGTGDGGNSADGPVRIHGADEYTGPVEMRRRLLDAMKEPSPAGFESAVGRYYQELLQ